MDIFRFALVYPFFCHRQDFYRAWLWDTCRVSFKKLKLFTLQELLGSSPFVLGEARVPRLSLVLLFCLSSFCVWIDHCWIPFGFLYCLIFFVLYWVLKLPYECNSYPWRNGNSVVLTRPRTATNASLYMKSLKIIRIHKSKKDIQYNGVAQSFYIVLCRLLFAWFFFLVFFGFFILTSVLSVLLRFTVSHYPFGIFKLYFHKMVFIHILHNSLQTVDPMYRIVLPYLSFSMFCSS